MAGLLELLSARLGSPSQTWSRDDGGGPLRVRVAEFPDEPVPGAAAIVTIGLSDHVLVQPSGSLRQELVLAMRAGNGVRDIPPMLEHLAGHAIDSQRAFLRGDFHDFGSPIIQDAAFTGLYVTVAVGFPSSVSLINGLHPEPVVLARLIPLTPSEVAFREAYGWQRLEDRLEATEVDLLDLERPSVL